MASTITALDYAVGDIYDALKKSGLYQNSVIIFSTDNGGAVQASSNLPLKGNKEELYEGGVRGVGFVNSPLLDNNHGKHDKLMFITDWFATILSLAGQSHLIPEDTDSYNMWPSLVTGQVESPRTQIILNIDQNNSLEQWSAAVIDDSWKFIWGQSYLLRQQLFPRYCRSWNTSAAILENINDCNVELYNLQEDPEEQNNLAAGGRRKERVNSMKEIIIKQLDRFVAADEPEDNPAGFPVNFGGFISTGWCNI
ncbi:arylsulfatase I [Eurytemora carolleeae]|uniref:arylsulfatase I n=1 Tax=Eurytemora carolleeae TaxID=1294199 RepID=UPI000C7843AD|nr:arylsulfatase I [Eurytemora carolleeae]|eukprot:XP_023325759.1 arylsulfatase I-like [Eurytemora affinis]